MGLQQTNTLMGYDFGGPDVAAAASQTQLYPFGLPDIADLAGGYIMPYAGQIAGISIDSAPVSTATLAAVPGLAAAALTAPLATATNAAPDAQTMETSSNQFSGFAAGAKLSCFYTTTNWSAKDAIVTVWVRFIVPIGDTVSA